MKKIKNKIQHKHFKKKGVSGVITAVLMVVLVMAATAIVWVVVKNLVSEKLETTESCFMTFGKITINSRYTCYDSALNEFQFSINMEDISIDELLIGIAGEGTTKSFKISNEETDITGLTNYPSGSSGIKLPGKNAGLTYIYDLTTGGFSMKPDSIEIAPIINGKQCDISDSLLAIDDCAVLA
ncbi:hypothetical protein KAR52_02360 [Candidatus Pacearchaeota archaeon]|nr:hypothetical protein [Candidatus Pacearchaeota archaeon]